MYSYTLYLDIYEFIDRNPEKLQGENRAKTGKNRSKCVSFFVDWNSGARVGGESAENGENFLFYLIHRQPSLKTTCRTFCRVRDFCRLTISFQKTVISMYNLHIVYILILCKYFIFILKTIRWILTKKQKDAPPRLTLSQISL